MGFKSYGGLVDVNGDNTGRVSRLSGGVVSLLDASDQVPFVAYTDWGLGWNPQPWGHTGSQWRRTLPQGAEERQHQTW